MKQGLKARPIRKLVPESWCEMYRAFSPPKHFSVWPTDEVRWPSLVWNEPLTLKQNLQNTLFQVDRKL
jgi:hypothetical protein